MQGLLQIGIEKFYSCLYYNSKQNSKEVGTEFSFIAYTIQRLAEARNCMNAANTF